MRGWIYAISNPEKPGLLRIGFSLKDPELQAEEFSDADKVSTPYKVEYDVLVWGGKTLQEELFLALDTHRDADGWVKLSLREAVPVIRAAVGKKMLLENGGAGPEAPSPKEAAAEKEAATASAETVVQERKPRPTISEVLEKSRGMLRVIYPDMDSINIGVGLFFVFLLLIWLSGKGLGVTLGYLTLIPLSLVLSVLWTYPVRAVLLPKFGIGCAEPADEKTVVPCPKCESKLRVPRGRKVLARCPACGERFQCEG